MAMHYRRHPPANNAVNPFTGRGLPAASPYRSAADNDGHGKSHSSLNMMAKKATLIILSFFMFFYILRSSSEDVAVENNSKQPPTMLKLPEVTAADTAARDGGKDYEPKTWDDSKQAVEEPDEYTNKQEDKNEFFDRDGSPDAKDSTGGIDNNPYDYHERREDADLYGNEENASQDFDTDYKRPTVSSVDRDALSGVEYKADSSGVGGDSQDFSIKKSDVEENGDGAELSKLREEERISRSNDGKDRSQDEKDFESSAKQVDANTSNSKIGGSDLVYKSTVEDESRDKLIEYGKRQDDGEEAETKYAKRTDEDESNETMNEYTKKDYVGRDSSRSAKLNDKDPDGDSREIQSEYSKMRKDDEDSPSSAKNEPETTYDKSDDGRGEANKNGDPNSKYHYEDKADEKVNEYSLQPNQTSYRGSDLISKKDDSQLVGSLDQSEVSSDIVETNTLEVPIIHSKYESNNKTNHYSTQGRGNFDENEAFKKSNSNLEKLRDDGEAVSDRDEPESAKNTSKHDAYESSEKTSEYSMQKPEDTEEAPSLHNSEDGDKWENIDSKYRTSYNVSKAASDSDMSQTVQGLDDVDKKTSEYTTDNEQSNPAETSKLETSRDDREGGDDHKPKVNEEHSKYDANNKISENSNYSDKNASPIDSADASISEKHDSKYVKTDQDGLAGSDNYKPGSFGDDHQSRAIDSSEKIGENSKQRREDADKYKSSGHSAVNLSNKTHDTTYVKPDRDEPTESGNNKDEEHASSKYDEIDADENSKKYSKKLNGDSSEARLTKAESKTAKSTENEKVSSVLEDENPVKAVSDENNSEYDAKSDKHTISINLIKEESERKENTYRSKFSDVEGATYSGKTKTVHKTLSGEGYLRDVEESRLISNKYPKDDEENNAPSNQLVDTNEDKTIAASKDALGSIESKSKGSKLLGGGAMNEDSHDATAIDESDRTVTLSPRDGDEDEESTRGQSMDTPDGTISGGRPQKNATVETDGNSSIPINKGEAFLASRGVETDASSSRAVGDVSLKSDKSVEIATTYNSSHVDEAGGKNRSKNVNSDENFANKSYHSGVQKNADANIIKSDEDKPNLESNGTGSVRGTVPKNDRQSKSKSAEDFVKSSHTSNSLRGSKKKSVIAFEDEHTKEGSDVKPSKDDPNRGKDTSSGNQLDEETKEKGHKILSQSNEVDKGASGSARHETVDEKKAEHGESKDIHDTDRTSKRYPKADEKDSEPLNQLPGQTSLNRTVVGDEDLASTLQIGSDSSKLREVGESSRKKKDAQVTEKSESIDSRTTRDEGEDKEVTRGQSFKTHEDDNSRVILQKSEVGSDEKSSLPVKNGEASLSSHVAKTARSGSSSKAEDILSTKSENLIENTSTEEASHVDETMRKRESKRVNSEGTPVGVATNKTDTVLDNTELPSEKEVNPLKVNEGKISKSIV